MVYGDGVSSLVAAAEEAGAPCCDGLSHLEAQAVAMLPLLGLDAASGLVRRAMTDVAGHAPRVWDRRG